LVNTGRGNLLFSQKQYDNFIIQLDFRIEQGADNGLLIRVDDATRRDVSRAMKIQIADDRNNMSGQDHNGSVVGALSGPKPSTVYDRNNFVVGWNFMEVIADGQRITTYVNGMKVADDVLPLGRPFSNVRSGHIGFIGNGGTTAIRNIRIKPLSAGENWRISPIAANDSREGFQRIFDGRTLNGWRGDLDRHRAENNILTNFSTPGKLETIHEYRNFVMRLDFRLTPGANNGVNIRKSGGNIAFEIQIADDTDTRSVWAVPGCIHGVVPARRGSSNAVGQWNTMEITANGSMIRVVVNDQIVLDTDIRNLNVSHSGFHNKSGHLEFTGARGQTEFRNIRVKELP
jgi:hypothetical protein